MSPYHSLLHLVGDCSGYLVDFVRLIPSLGGIMKESIKQTPGGRVRKRSPYGIWKASNDIYPQSVAASTDHKKRKVPVHHRLYQCSMIPRIGEGVRNLTVTRGNRVGVDSGHKMHTRGKTTSAARNAVFNTHELVEQILGYLTSDERFEARGTNKHINTLVTTYPKLARDSFLVRDTHKNALQFDKPQLVVIKHHPSNAARYGEDWNDRQTGIRTSVLNTTFFATDSDEKREALVARCETCETLTLAAQPNLQPLTFEGIWHRQYVANPPPVEVEIDVAFIVDKPRKCRRVDLLPRKLAERSSIANNFGVTWADVVADLGAVLFVANQQETRDVKWKVDGAKCKLWMKGVVFPMQSELKVLDDGGWLTTGNNVTDAQVRVTERAV